MRAPVDFNLALVQPVAPFAHRIGRQTQSCSVFANAHSAPVHRLDMHRPERGGSGVSARRQGADVSAPRGALAGRDCVRAPDVGAYASDPYTRPPCEPAWSN
jgi:hypothetical protein